MKIYLVGGAVRDELLGLAIKERDWVVVGATPEEMLIQGFMPVGKSFPVFLHPDTKEEYALARLERKVAGGYHGFAFDTSKAVTLEEDLMRRDITINAIAKAPDGTLIDPYGGQQDLQQKILRHVSPAFLEDPVRVLRIARFAARFGFTVAPQTQVLMQEMVRNGELNYLVPERVWKEMSRALAEEMPLIFIEVLRQCGALKILLPEVDNLYVKSEDKNFISTLREAVKLSKQAEVRFAALLLNNPLSEIKQLCNRLKVPREYQDLAQLTAKYHDDCHELQQAKLPKSDIENFAANILKLLEQCDALRKPERLAQFLLVCEADFHAKKACEKKMYYPLIYLPTALMAIKKIDTKELIIKMGKDQVVSNSTEEKERFNMIGNTDINVNLLKSIIQKERILAIGESIQKFISQQ